MLRDHEPTLNGRLLLHHGVRRHAYLPNVHRDRGRYQLPSRSSPWLRRVLQKLSSSGSPYPCATLCESLSWQCVSQQPCERRLRDREMQSSSLLLYALQSCVSRLNANPLRDLYCVMMYLFLP